MVPSYFVLQNIERWKYINIKTDKYIHIQAGKYINIWISIEKKQVQYIHVATGKFVQNEADTYINISIGTAYALNCLDHFPVSWGFYPVIADDCNCDI